MWTKTLREIKVKFVGENFVPSKNFSTDYTDLSPCISKIKN